MIHIGIDPGKEGVIVSLEVVDGEILKIEKKLIPKLPGTNIIDDQALNQIFIDIKKNMLHHIVLEDVHAIYGSAASATFSFGDVCGLIRGLIVAHELAYTKVQPKVWQKEMFQGIPEIRKPNKKNGQRGNLDTKPMSIMAAKRLFPGVSLLRTERSKKDSDGISDALLMAEYSRRKFS